MCQVYKVPASKGPMVIISRRVFEADQEVDCVVTDFVSGNFRLKVERAEGAVAAARRVELGIESKKLFTGRGEDDFAKGDLAKFVIVLQEPGDESVYSR